MTPEKSVLDAFEAGWSAASGWAGRDDLLADIGSPAYCAEVRRVIPGFGLEGLDPDEQARVARSDLARSARELGPEGPVLESVLRDVFEELHRAMVKFPTWPTDPLHALAVVGEEFGELTQAVLQRTYEPHKSTAEDVRAEAVQTAASALRFLMNLQAFEYVPSTQQGPGGLVASRDVPKRALTCPKCGVDRCKAPCPASNFSECGLQVRAQTGQP